MRVEAAAACSVVVAAIVDVVYPLHRNSRSVGMHQNPTPSTDKRKHERYGARVARCRSRILLYGITKSRVHHQPLHSSFAVAWTGAGAGASAIAFSIGAAAIVTLPFGAVAERLRSLAMKRAAHMLGLTDEETSLGAAGRLSARVLHTHTRGLTRRTRQSA